MSEPEHLFPCQVAHEHEIEVTVNLDLLRQRRYAAVRMAFRLLCRKMRDTMQEHPKKLIVPHRVGHQFTDQHLRLYAKLHTLTPLVPEETEP